MLFRRNAGALRRARNVDRPCAAMEAIARDGLLIDGLRIRERIPVATTTNLEGVRPADVVLCCVKTTSTETTAFELRPHLRPDAAILSFQNGVDNVDRIFTAIG